MKLIKTITPFIALLFLLNTGINYLQSVPESTRVNIPIAHATPITPIISLPYITKENNPHIIPLSIEDKIRQAFPDNFPVMLAIAKAESSLDPLATNTNTNGSIDTGLFQINSIHQFPNDLTDIDYNIQCAKIIFEKQGLQAWSAYNNGKYLDYL